MLRKYYDCNNSVTNVESGSRSAIVRNGHQILHCQKWRGLPRPRALLRPSGCYYTRGQAGKAGRKLEAESRELEAGQDELKRERMNKMNKLNKAAIITNVIIVIIMALLAHACYLKGEHAGADEMMSHVYPMSGIVTEVNRQEDRVVVTDSTGNEWEFDGAEDWHTGDIAAMIMEDNGTEEVYDDEIIDIQYDGWVE